MKYEKPSLQEIELLLEGSFLGTDTNPGDTSVPVDPNPDDGKDPGIWG